VLVVEDYADVRDIFAAFLTARGYDVLTAGDGLEALDVARANVPHLILLDLKMPRMDGETFRREQLADPQLAAAPVIVLSGNADADDVAARMGAVACLRKPIDSSTLLSTVARYLP
jgi:CheY-like chemotaxis protein